MRKERPIVFSGPMVKAILEGRKTQTRRVVKPQPAKDYVTFMPLSGELVGVTKHGGEVDNRGWLHCPYGQPGDRLWVRETWAPVPVLQHVDGSVIYSDNAATYKASRDVYSGIVDRWRPPIHMPRWASRITLEVVSVRVERLQDINEEDAKAEGVPAECGNIAVDTYAALWDKINGPGSWDANPWVWVVEFRKLP